MLEDEWIGVRYKMIGVSEEYCRSLGCMASPLIQSSFVLGKMKELLLCLSSCVSLMFLFVHPRIEVAAVIVRHSAVGWLICAANLRHCPTLDFTTFNCISISYARHDNQNCTSFTRAAKMPWLCAVVNSKGPHLNNEILVERRAGICPAQYSS